jgi:hypothetical protein
MQMCVDYGSTSADEDSGLARRHDGAVDEDVGDGMPGGLWVVDRNR